MILETCSIKNFGSYKNLTFNFKNTGLSLIQGQTGSGKSTICDAACWLLYGQTAKNGNVDEVRSWQASDEPTTGHIRVQLPDNPITVYRTRGKSNQNDLWWEEEGSTTKKRGKDINETQKLLEARLGVSAELYLIGSYFSDFSPAANFFIAKSKDRREVFEKVAKLDFAIKLEEQVKNAKKQAASILSNSQRTLSSLASKISQTRFSIEDSSVRRNVWIDNRNNRLHEIREKNLGFDSEINRKRKTIKKALEKLDSQISPADYLFKKYQLLRYEYDHTEITPCSECGGTKGLDKKTKHKEEADAAKEICAENTRNIKKKEELQNQLYELDTSINPYEDQLKQEENSINPFIDQEECNKKLLELFKTEAAAVDLECNTLTTKIDSLDQLEDLVSELKTTLLKKSIEDIEAQTNSYLEKYFNSAIRVDFILDGPDTLQASIQKSGYGCTYKQLSKGQRQLLKLCFSVSVMQIAANRAGVHFDCLLFDEALDGLDSEFKIKAFDLFSSLSTEHGSVLLIDHAEEFKNLFTNKYEVALVGDNSEIYQES